MTKIHEARVLSIFHHPTFNHLHPNVGPPIVVNSKDSTLTIQMLEVHN